MIPESSIIWQQYQALSELLPPDQPGYFQIAEQFRRHDIGQASEDSLAFYLQQTHIPLDLCIKRLRLEHHVPFQLDWLILTEAFRVIFEVKGHTGEIYFDAKSHQLVRESETKRKYLTTRSCRLTASMPI
ncbi:NERD domain-containing protein [Gracilibacillus caseinilyticus]|uniref:NERD domain-containing protein n=1 Tax=Gracilibacillus caseinilyticus TaxID=2932256 RepID=A0ABY4F2B5_9BACI|nr:NERD domain-containing protein [Gracilibacillus caseinilyticus]UOQ50207.1 NERD domain-containing protein [Gracilibacillus caseinilyticus]